MREPYAEVKINGAWTPVYSEADWLAYYVDGYPTRRVRY